MERYQAAYLAVASVVAGLVWLKFAQHAFQDGVDDFAEFLLNALMVATFGAGSAVILGMLWPLVLVLFIVWLIVR